MPPSILTAAYSPGISNDSRTLTNAARWLTYSGRARANTSSNAPMSRRSACKREALGLTFSARPWTRLSTTKTSWYAASKASTTCEPINPAPPVTRIRLIELSLLMSQTLSQTPHHFRKRPTIHWATCALSGRLGGSGTARSYWLPTKRLSSSVRQRDKVVGEATRLHFICPIRCTLAGYTAMCSLPQTGLPSSSTTAQQFSQLSSPSLTNHNSALNVSPAP